MGRITLAQRGRVVSGSLTGGMSPTWVEDEAKLLSALDPLVKPADTLLFKGSRCVSVGRIADAFEKLT